MSKDSIARDLAYTFEQCNDTQPVFNLAHDLAKVHKVVFVFCIDKIGLNHSKAFDSADMAEEYFEKECPVASQCQFKFRIYP